MIQNLKLSNFRNFGKKEIIFGESVNIISAPNASGKTNILEAISFLSTGKSFKAKKEQECIKYEEQIARITAIYHMPYVVSEENNTAENIKHNTDIEVVLTKDVEGWPKKRLLVNGVSRRLSDFAGNIKTVLFAPQDLELITGSPAERRNFLDTVLCQTDREYRRALLSYEKGIRQRNRVLFRIREENFSRNNLLFWNQLLIKNGNYITEKRRGLIDYINNLGRCFLEYDFSAISEGRLDQYKEAEVASATTLVGPHRDDLIFLKNSRNIASYGSRGEQRMEVLYLKLAELKYIEETTNTKPILLLDDIFSELDHMHREIVMKVINNHQVIITSAGPHNLRELETKNILNIDL